MKSNELIECFREIVKNFDNTKNCHIDAEVIYWRTKYLSSLENNLAPGHFTKIRRLFLSLRCDEFIEKTSEEWIDLIKKEYLNEN